MSADKEKPKDPVLSHIENGVGFLITSEFIYKGKTIYLVEELKKTTPALCIRKRIFMDMEFFRVAPLRIADLVCNHEVQEIELWTNEMPHWENHVKIVKNENPELRQKAAELWIRIMRKRLKNKRDILKHMEEYWHEQGYL